MFGNAEVAGFIQVQHTGSQEECNTWLSENPDVEVLDIKFSCDPEYVNILIVYRKES